MAGQELACGWCGQPVTVKARGPVPKWCSPACRQRAWEASRAASSGKTAVQVVDRDVLVIPGDGPGWVAHLGLLARQLGQGPTMVADHDLDAVAVALDAPSRRSPSGRGGGDGSNPGSSPRPVKTECRPAIRQARGSLPRSLIQEQQQEALVARLAARR